jgi:hypothetical protein
LETQTAQSVKDTDLSLNTMTRNKNAGRERHVYDLNIYQLEQVNADGEYEYMGPWYIHIYDYYQQDITEVSAPIELTPQETEALIVNDSYYDELDVWYGLDGFMLEKWNVMSDRLKMIFETLPKYRDDVEGYLVYN